MLCCAELHPKLRVLVNSAVAPALHKHCVLCITLLCHAVVQQLSPECVAAAENVDLVVVEGMGRAIETNLYASFSCDSLKLAMVKHPEVGLALPPPARLAPSCPCSTSRPPPLTPCSS